MTTVTVPTNTTCVQPVPRSREERSLVHGQHRRHLLGALAVAPVAAAMPAMAIEAAVVDPHAAWETEAAELRLQSTAADCNYDEEGSNDLWGAAWDIEEKVVTTMPATMSGLLVQLRVAAMRLDMGVGPDDGGMLRGILAGAERLAGRA